MHGIARFHGGRRVTILRGLLLALASPIGAGLLQAQQPNLKGVQMEQAALAAARSTPVRTDTADEATAEASPPVAYVESMPFPLRIPVVTPALLYGSTYQEPRPASYSSGLVVRAQATTNQLLALHARTQQLLRRLDLPWFMPLVTPVIGVEVQSSMVSQAPGFPVPPTLRFLGRELFYPALVQRVTAKQVSKEMEQEVYLYCQEKSRLKSEAYRFVRSLREGKPEERATLVEAECKSQEAAIQAFEAHGEALRVSLTQGLKWRETAASAPADTRGKASAPGETPAGASAPVPDLSSQPPSWRFLRDMATFQPGLSAAQRRLLLEVAAEQVLNSVGPVTAKESQGRVIFLDPDCLRLQIPAGISAGLSSQVDAYIKAKAEVKAALLELAAKLRREANEQQAEERCHHLAVLQAPAFEALERQVTALRPVLARELSLARESGLLAKVGMPDDIIHEIDLYQKLNRELQAGLRKRLLEAREEAKQASQTDSSVRVPRVSDVTRVYERENASRYDELGRMRAHIRDSIEKVVTVQADPDPLPNSPQAQLTREFGRALQEVVVVEQYSICELAALEPGLSPSYRRLLLDLALLGLSQREPDE